ncbi:MAG: hypothetical protein M5U26_25545 [Planctomycetota bacterium]|nr:hypothetical protein [Planctomycetota bacterium]
MTPRAPILLLLACAAPCLSAGEASSPLDLTAGDLQRVPVPRSGIFPWKVPDPGQPAKPELTKPKTPPQEAGLMDVSGGDVVMRACGPFSRVEKVAEVENGKKRPKEQFILSNRVEIEQPSTGVVLRGDKIEVERDLGSGDVELLQALGAVEIVLPGQWAKGESLSYESRFGEGGKLTRQLITVSGDLAKGKPATLGSGDNLLQAFKFVMDLRLDTYRALGGALAEVRLPSKGDAPGASAGGGMVPQLSLASGGMITISCDGEMLFESYSGKLTLKRSVQIEQAALKMWTDELVLRVQSTEPNVEGSPGPSTIFTGSLQSIECIGRVELLSGAHTVHCDRLLYDLEHARAILEMKEPKDDVKIYISSPATPGECGMIKIKHLLKIDTKTSTFIDGSPKGMDIHKGAVPELRPHRAPKIRMLKEQQGGSAP